MPLRMAFFFIDLIAIFLIQRSPSIHVPTAFQELTHSFIHRLYWLDNRLQSLKTLALQ
jgi:hypothetical protein